VLDQLRIGTQRRRTAARVNGDGIPGYPVPNQLPQYRSRLPGWGEELCLPREHPIRRLTELAGCGPYSETLAEVWWTARVQTRSHCQPKSSVVVWVSAAAAVTSVAWAATLADGWAWEFADGEHTMTTEAVASRMKRIIAASLSLQENDRAIDCQNLPSLIAPGAVPVTCSFPSD